MKTLMSLILAVVLSVSPVAAVAHQGDIPDEVWSGETMRTLHNEMVNTPLIHATAHADAEGVKRLLNDYADPNQTNGLGITALMLAVSSGDAEVAEILLSSGADPNLANSDGTTALMALAVAGKKVVETLWDDNPNLDATLTYLLLSDAQLATGKLLLDNGAEPNLKDNNGWTALMHAASAGQAKIVKLLLDGGANPNFVNKYGSTPLIWAARKGHTDIVQMLLDSDAKTDLAGKDGKTALDYAKKAEHADIIIMLDPAITSPTVRLAPPPKTEKTAAWIFNNSWQSIVVVKSGGNQGSGVIISPNIVATNCHVIDGDSKITVYKHDNQRASTDTLFSAKISRSDYARDYCELYVPSLQGVVAEMRRYNTLKTGDKVYAIGSPKGLDLSMSTGIISQLRQDGNKRIIQTDAAISPGSSGGGLFDSGGHLIGITTAVHKDEDAENIGFAIPADLALEL